MIYNSSYVMQKIVAIILICTKVASSTLIIDLFLTYWCTASFEIYVPVYAFVALLKLLLYSIVLKFALKIEKTESTGAFKISIHGDNNPFTVITLPDHYEVAGLRNISLIAM
jgi:hypothetical protein